MNLNLRQSLATLALLPLAVALTPAVAHADGPAWTADVRADANRDGVVTAADEAVEDSAAAIVLPNLDDDSRRCPSKVKVPLPKPPKAPKKGAPKSEFKAYNKAMKAYEKKRSAVGLKIDRRLNACNDATDAKVNGAADVADLAPITTVPLPDVPADATGTLRLDTTRARLFQQVADGSWRMVTPSTRLTAQQLRDGVRLGVEAKDINRDAATWNGRVKVTLEVTAGSQRTADTVTLSVAPMLSHTHLQRAEMMLAPQPMSVRKDSAMKRFNAQLTEVAHQAGVTGGVKVMPTEEAWQQDYVEPMYVSMPTSSGTHSIRLLLRSHQNRDTGHALYSLRGKDVGVVWQGKEVEYSTLNSMGNFETIPPFSHAGKTYASGRIILGRDEEKNDHGQLSTQMLTMLAAQGGVEGGIQQPLILNTGWLGVGHVDEFLSSRPPTHRAAGACSSPTRWPRSTCCARPSRRDMVTPTSMRG